MTYSHSSITSNQSVSFDQDKEGKENTNTQLSEACNNQELPPHNAEKRGLDGEEGENLDTERYSTHLSVLQKMNWELKMNLFESLIGSLIDQPTNQPTNK